MRMRFVPVFSLIALIALSVVAKEEASTIPTSAPRAVVAALEHNFGTIKPGTPDTESYRGEVAKTATVTTNDPDRPTFTLTLKATFAAE